MHLLLPLPFIGFNNNVLVRRPAVDSEEQCHQAMRCLRGKRDKPKVRNNRRSVDYELLQSVEQEERLKDLHRHFNHIRDHEM